VCACVHVCIYVHVCMCVYMHMYICACVHMCMYEYVYMYMCAYVYVCMCAFMGELNFKGPVKFNYIYGLVWLSVQYSTINVLTLMAISPIQHH
jgi:hypothetical protein